MSSLSQPSPSRSAAAASRSPAETAAIWSSRAPGSRPARPNRPAYAPRAASAASAEVTCSRVERAPAGGQVQGGVHGGPPGPLTEPDIYRTGLVISVGHVHQPPATPSAAHSATTARTSARGRHGEQPQPGEFPQIGCRVVVVQDAPPQQGGQ